MLVDQDLVGQGIFLTARDKLTAHNLARIGGGEGIKPVGAGGVAQDLDGAAADPETGGGAGQTVGYPGQIIGVAVVLGHSLALFVKMGEKAVLIGVSGDIIEDHGLNFTLCVERVPAHLSPVQGQSGQTAGIDHRTTAVAHIQDFRPLGKGIFVQLGAVGAHFSADGAAAQPPECDLAPLAGDGGPDHAALLCAAFGLVLIGLAVGGQKGHGLGGVGAAGAVREGGLGDGGDNANLFTGAGRHVCHRRCAAAAAQQKGNRVPQVVLA